MDICFSFNLVKKKTIRGMGYLLILQLRNFDYGDEMCYNIVYNLVTMVTRCVITLFITW